MDVASPCESCGERKAVTNCDVCGASVCRSCKLEYGCKLCEGGKRKLDG